MRGLKGQVAMPDAKAGTEGRRRERETAAMRWGMHVSDVAAGHVKLRHHVEEQQLNTLEQLFFDLVYL